MSFPTSPVDGQVYNNYEYDATKIAWLRLTPFTPVRAEYKSASGTAARNPINVTGKVEDTHNAVTTGSNWKFTTPENGVYLCMINTYNGTANANVALYRNGSLYRYCGATMTAAVAGLSGVSVRLEADQYIDFRHPEAGTGQPIDSNVWISITKISN